MASASLVFLVAGTFLAIASPIPARLRANANARSDAAFSKPLSKRDSYIHALDRLTFGPRPGDLEELRRVGLKQWLNQQLNPESISESPALDRRLEKIEALRMSGETSGEFPTGGDRRRLANGLSEAKILRAVYSRRQLAELLDDFWFNHFNVFLNKGRDRYLLADYEREVIRPHVLGNFHDLLLATAKSPAMLFYLDNWQSVAPKPSAYRLTGTGKGRRGLNENYGRELLELHTLGVDGGYTQKDVTDVARCFTGWTIAKPPEGGGFRYNDRVHDKGEKVVLGHVIPAGGGMSDGLEVLDILAHHPSTAHFVSLKLAQQFVADNPPQALVQRMSKTFLKTGGDLRQVMRTMVLSREFWSEGAYRAKVKTPLEIVASAARATGAQVTSTDVLAAEIQKMGEPLYLKIEPTGYSGLNSEWVSSAALLERMNFAVALAENRIPGVTIPTASNELSDGTQARTRMTAEALASPEYQRR